eukprot:CAMPEP_0181113592 /NCGR_PEP_ID=MMETSP1071-20121207/20430_1 /TAXON_ID=35127 /ORGANISM="Thalassiosira sp., Strain NH16" /LENGTH=97 /DNA_ID=CAMNT_0023197641 /DNA_START=314 /DNA_END=608 /DNA_ORIENTATION=+
MGDDAVAEAESEELEDGSLSTSEIAIITCGSVRVTMSSSCCSEPFTSRFVQTDLVAGSSSSDEEKASRIMDGLRAMEDPYESFWLAAEKDYLKPAFQ